MFKSCMNLRTLWLLAALLATWSTWAGAAAGVDLAWNHCRGKTGAVINRSNACTSTNGQQSLIASFNPPPGITQLEGAEIVIDYQESGGAVSCWWNFSTGAPRSAALRRFFVPPTDINGDVAIICGMCTIGPCTPFGDGSDGYYFLSKGGTGSGGGTVPVGNTAQLLGTVAIPAGSGTAVPADVQQYAFGFQILNTLTGPSCPGCSNTVQLTLSRVTLMQPGVPNTDLTTPNLGNSITYNGGIIATRNETWGSVKALYRN